MCSETFFNQYILSIYTTPKNTIEIEIIKHGCLNIFNNFSGVLPAWVDKTL